MKASFSIKFITVIVVFSLVFGPLAGNLFIKRVKAQQQGQAQGQGQQSFGASVGKAVGAGLACFGATYLETVGAGWLFGGPLAGDAAAEGRARAGVQLLAVPEVGVGAPYSERKASVDMGIDKSKDCIRDTVAKIILDWLVDQIVIWIQGGGEPKFVTNWRTFLDDAVNVGVGEVINQSNFQFLCSPFRLQVQLSLLPVPRFQERISCTLDQVVDNIEDFYNDFSKGGWIAYNEMWQPQNNYYGQILLFYDEAMMKGLAAKEAAEKEALAGGGFRGPKQCKIETEWDAEEIRANGYEPEDFGLIKDSTGRYCAMEDLEESTPGSLVGRVAGEALTSDIRWAENVKSWVAAIINAVVNRLITEGVTYMKSSKEEPTGYGTAGYKGDFNPTAGGKATRITSEQYKGDTEAENARNQLPIIVENYRKILADRQAILTSKQQSLSTVRDLIRVLEEMKNKSCSEFNQKDLDDAKNAETALVGKIAQLESVIAEVEANLTEAESVGETVIQSGE